MFTTPQNQQGGGHMFFLHSRKAPSITTAQNNMTKTKTLIDEWYQAISRRKPNRSSVTDGLNSKWSQTCKQFTCFAISSVLAVSNWVLEMGKIQKGITYYEKQELLRAIDAKSVFNYLNYSDLNEVLRNLGPLIKVLL